MAHSILDVESTLVELQLDQCTLSIQSPTECNRVRSDRRPTKSSRWLDLQSTIISNIILVDDDEQNDLLEYDRLSQPIQTSPGSNVYAGQIVQVQCFSRPAEDRAIFRLPGSICFIVIDTIGQSSTTLRE